jgi:hypothetical protein
MLKFQMQHLPVHCWTDKVGQNLLHLAALDGGVEVMQVLTDADLRGIDPYGEDNFGYAPNDCFYVGRQPLCTIIRPPFEVEEKAWLALMDSARRRNGLIEELEDDDDENGDETEVQSEAPDGEGTVSDGDEESDGQGSYDAEEEIEEPLGGHLAVRNRPQNAGDEEIEEDNEIFADALEELEQA